VKEGDLLAPGIFGSERFEGGDDGRGDGRACIENAGARLFEEIAELPKELYVYVAPGGCILADI
jgi:hypothetical protein